MRRLFGAAVIAAGLIASAASAQPVGIGTSPQGTLTYALGAAFARALSESAGIQARVQPGSGTGVIIPLVDSGEIDLGFVNALEITEAFRGVGSFEGRPQKNLRMLGVLFPIRVGLFVRNDSAIRTLADIRGKSVVYGYTSTPILKTVVEAEPALTINLRAGSFHPPALGFVVAAALLTWHWRKRATTATI